MPLPAVTSRKTTTTGHIALRPSTYYPRSGSQTFTTDPPAGKLNHHAEAQESAALKNDGHFKKAHNDLVNLIPTVGELNGARSHLLYGLIDAESREYGNCDFEADGAVDISEPRDDIRGDIARIYFYMRDTYELTFPDALVDILEDLDIEDEISQVEIDRNARVNSVQGTSNPFVSEP